MKKIQQDNPQSIDSYKGKLLYEAVTNEPILNSIKVQKQAFIHYILILIGCVALLLGINYTLIVNNLDLDQITVVFILDIIMVPILYISLWAITNISFSKDQIYENGISSLTHTLRDYLNNNTFHRFDEITKIGWGYYQIKGVDKRPYRFVAIYVNNEYRHTTIINDKKKINEFFDILIKTLKEKCPNVPWVNQDWNTLPWPR